MVKSQLRQRIRPEPLGTRSIIATCYFSSCIHHSQIGVPTPRPYRMVTDGERVGAEYELVENKRSFARVARELHSIKADTAKLPSMKKRMQEFYLKEGVVPGFLRDRVLPILDSIPDTPICLHGDMQIGNIITDGRWNLWIDIGQCAYGVPEWDISLCWRVSQIADPKMTDNLFHLTPEQMKQHWNIFAPAYYGLAPQEMGSIIKRILPYAAIKSAYMYYLTFHKPIPDDMGHRLLDSMLG